MDDEASLAKTIERRPTRSAPRMSTPRLASELLRDPRAAIGAAVWIACVVAGITGVLLGHTRPSRAHAKLHDSVVLEAREEITELPVLASGKETADNATTDEQAMTDERAKTDEQAAPAAPAAAIAPVARPMRRAGFGHLGADRVASGTVTRRPAHRR